MLKILKIKFTTKISTNADDTTKKIDGNNNRIKEAKQSLFKSKI